MAVWKQALVPVLIQHRLVGSIQAAEQCSIVTPAGFVGLI